MTKTYEILSQFTGDFLGACEVVEGDNYAELWSVSGVDTLINIEGHDEEALFKLIIDEFCFESGLPRTEVYLTDEDHSEILCAM